MINLLSSPLSLPQGGSIDDPVPWIIYGLRHPKKNWLSYWNCPILRITMFLCQETYKENWKFNARSNEKICFFFCYKYVDFLCFLTLDSLFPPVNKFFDPNRFASMNLFTGYSKILAIFCTLAKCIKKQWYLTTFDHPVFLPMITLKKIWNCVNLHKNICICAQEVKFSELPEFFKIIFRWSKVVPKWSKVVPKWSKVEPFDGTWVMNFHMCNFLYSLFFVILIIKK